MVCARPMATSNKIADSAHHKVFRAIRRGELEHPTNLPCADAEDNFYCSASEYHHEDYAKPLDVIPLCRYHHKKRHHKKRHEHGRYFLQGKQKRQGKICEQNTSGAINKQTSTQRNVA